MTVNPETSKHRFDHDGTTYHFCSAGCRDQIRRRSRKISRQARLRRRPTLPEGTIYTCPMHPEIRQVGPGSCPICGMALEPEVASLDSGPNPELADMTRRFWIGALLSAPTVVLEMGGHLVGGHGWVDPTLSNWIQFAFATPVVLWAGWPFFVRGWQSLHDAQSQHVHADRDGHRRGLSLQRDRHRRAADLSGDLPRPWRRGSRSISRRPSVITVLVLLGQVLELRAREATSGAIKALLRLAPKTARRIGDDGHEHEVEIDSLAVGDSLRVRPGEKVPVDGVILEGRSALDESLVTGESMPVTKEAGARVIAGTLNQSGGFVMRADKVGRDTLLSQIVQMVADAQRSRAPIQRLADQVAGWFVPVVIAVAIAAFAAWAWFGPEPRMAFGLVAAVSVLIIACPCALGLATPMSIMVGVGRGAQAGVLIKNAEALERMERVDTLVVDKTGTLTEGKPKVVAIVPATDLTESEILRLAASVEQASEHPLADAIVRAAKERAHRPEQGRRTSIPRPARARSARSTARRLRSATPTTSLRSALTRPHSTPRPNGCAAMAPPSINLRDRRQARRPLRHCRSGEGVDAGGAEGARRRGHQGDHADRRQQDHRASRGAPARHRRRRSRGAAGPEERGRRKTAEGRAAWSRWPATASTTRRRWPRPKSASPWAPAPMWRWKARA